MAVPSDPSAARGHRGVPGVPVRGHEFVRHSRETGHDYAKGYPAGEEDKGGLGGVGVMLMVDVGW